MPRQKCPTCNRPSKQCLCSWLKNIENSHKIIILRHKTEARHSLNTANILQHCLSHCTLIDGEIFAPIDHGILIYPGENSISLNESAPIASRQVFILLDGTWRKTRKILHLNPWLLKLPQIKLPEFNSKYILRKKAPEGFSTLEAAVSLLGNLENNDLKYTPLLEAMKQMMQFQIDKMGPETYQNNYKL